MVGRPGWLRSVSFIACGGAVALVGAGPALTAGAAPRHSRAPAQVGAAGVVYGGVTSQRLPIVLEVSRNGSRVALATTAVRLSCAAGGQGLMPDGYVGLSIAGGGRFGTSFGPTTNRNDDGTTTDFEGAIRGRFNPARTRASGTWKLKVTTHDAAGAVTDTCDSRTVTWRAKQ